MANDRGRLPRVAWFLVLVGIGGCGLRAARPDTPFPEEGVAHKERVPHSASGGSRELLVGELCPQALAGRPAVAPLLLRSAGWTDNAAEVTGAVERGATPRFAAFGTDGKLAGVFESAGLADVTLGQSVAAGTYVGGAPCSAGGDDKGARVDDAACLAATGGCGLAIAELARPDDPPETPKFATAGACLAGAAMGLDVDGDGINEWFPLSGVLDGTRGPAQEWSAGLAIKGPCNASFTSYNVKLTPETEAGKNTDPRAAVMLDLLGVLDLDGDGRKDVVLALRFPTVRTIVVYSATASPQRLELVGEAQSFQPGVPQPQAQPGAPVPVPVPAPAPAPKPKRTR